jgi:ornithine carbamoyltransferase
VNDLLRVADLATGELIELIESALQAKRDPTSLRGIGEGRVVAVLFEKPSLRTRFSVEAALARLGAHPVGAYDKEVGLGSREPLDDAARVLARYVDAIVIRTFGHERAEELAAAADVPVVNALSDLHHPLQALADLQTIVEHRCNGNVHGLKAMRISYVGDGNNVAHSLIEACALVGARLVLACPAGYEPNLDIVSEAKHRSSDIAITSDVKMAVAGADVVYTDVWASMGQERESESRRSTFAPYRVTAELMAEAAPDAIFLHCLPAHRGDEVDAEVIDGPQSRVFDQAENRLHTTAAVFRRIFEGG